MENKTSQKKLKFLKEVGDFFVANRYVRRNWCIFFILCFIGLAFDIAIKYSYNNYIAYMDFPFIKDFLMKIRNILQDNFVELLISQISITFLVTSLLSIFGSNEKYIYWENAIEYKLIKPLGESFRDITAYCFGTLPISVFAIIFRLNFLFILSFAINIFGLTVITIRMFTIYFGREKICNEMKDEFLTLKKEEKEQKIRLLEANTYRHIENYNVSAILENTNFLRDFALKNAAQNINSIFDALLRIYNALPSIFPEIKTDIVITLFDLTGFVDFEKSPYKSKGFLVIEPLIQEEIRHRITDKKSDSQNEEKSYEEFKESAFTVVKNDIFEQTMDNSQKKNLLLFYELLVFQGPLNRILNMIDTERGFTKENQVNYSEYFSKSVELIKLAKDNMQDIAPYIYSLNRLYNYVYEIALGTLEEEGKDPISREKSKQNEEEHDKLADSICDVVKCFEKETALLLFKLLCDDYAINSDKKFILPFLQRVYYSTYRIDSATKEKMIAIIEKSTLEYKGSLIEYIKSKE